MATVGRLQQTLGHAPNSIVVFRALVVGDMLCAVPALRALRRAYPAAHIALVGLPWAAEFVNRFSVYLDEFIEFPGYPGLPERTVDLARVPSFLAEMQSRRFDVAIQLHGSGSFVNELCVLMGARLTAGYYVPGQFHPCEATFLAYPNELPEVRRHLRLMQHLGIEADGEHLELPVSKRDYAELHALSEYSDLLGQPFVCVHPGARYASRRWRPEYYAGVADRLWDAGYKVVITGTASEAAIAAEVEQRSSRPLVNLTGRTTLGTLAALLTESRLLISNDTGVSHVAAALRVPSVVVVTGSDPCRWAPLDTQRHRTVMGPIACRPCEHVVCPIGFPCADAISVDEVVAQALAMLGGFAPVSLLAS